MKTNYNLFDNNASGLNILLNGNSECTENKLFKTANEALENLYEIYNESVSRFIEYKAAAYLEKLVVENAIFEKEPDVILNESCETQESMNDLSVNLKEWVDVLNTSVNSLDNWNHCIETSETILNLLKDNNMSEEKILKSIKESLEGFKGITLNMENFIPQNLEEKGDLDMKNSRVSKLISDKELTLNGLKSVSESMELLEDLNAFEKSITDLKVKIYDNDGEVTQEAYEMLLDLDVLEEGLKDKIKAVGEKRIDKKIAKKEAQIEKIKARLEKEKADFDISEYEEDLKACEEKGDEKGAAKIRKRMERMKDNHAYDIEEMEEDIKAIQGEIEKLRSKKNVSSEEVTQESYISLVFDDEELGGYVEEGLKDKLSQMKDKGVAKKIAKKEAQITKIKARIEKEKEAHKNYMDDFEGDLEYCREKGDEKGAAKIEKRIAKEKENHAYDIEEMEEDIKTIEGEIEKLKGKINAADGEVTQEAYAILENLDVLEEGLKAKVKAIGDKRLNKKLAKRENLLGKMKQMLLDVQDEEHKAKIQSDITDLEADIEKIRAKMNKNVDEVVQESYLDVIFESTIYDIIDEEEYTEEGLRQKIRDMKDNSLNNKINKKEAKLAEMKARLGEMQTPEDDKKKAKLEADIEKVEKEVEKLKAKVKSEPGDNIVEGEGTQESTEIDDENLSLEAYEIQMLEAQLEEMEAKIEAKQQVLNESYSYRTEIELEVLEEGLKEIKGKLEGVREKLADKCYNWVAKKYTSQTRIEYHLDELKATLEDAENLLKSREGESKGAKAKRLAGNIVTLMVCPPLLVVLRQNATVLSSEKNLRTTIKYAKMEMAAFRKRLNELNGQGKGEEEAPAQEMFSVEEAAELAMMFDALIEQEEKIEAKQQVLNESYSYRTEIELEVLEEGLKDIKAKIGAKMDARREKKYDKKMKKAKSETELRRHIEDLKIKIERAETVKKEKESESKAKKAAKIVGSIVVAVGLGIVITGPTNKQLDKAIKYAQMEIKASEKRIAELEALKGKGEEETPAQESLSIEEAAEIMALIESIIDYEEKIEAKQQVLNESYSYRTEIELEVLEEGLKDAKEKASAKANDMLVKVYKTPEKLRKAIEKEKKFIEEAEACLQSREEDSSKIKKFAKMVGRSLVYAMAGNAIQPKVSLGANPSKVIRKHIKSSQHLIAAAERRLAKMEGENAGGEETPAQENFSVQETAEIMALIESIIEYETKIEAKQQVLNESYSYRTEIELEVLEEGLKGSVNNLIEKVKKPVYDWICNKYNNNASIAKVIDRLEGAIKNAKAAKNSAENTNQLVAAVSVCPKVKGLVAGKALAAVGGVSALLVIAGVLLKLYKKRKAELAKGEEVKPEDKQEEVKESVDYAQLLAEELAKIDFED